MKSVVIILFVLLSVNCYSQTVKETLGPVEKLPTNHFDSLQVRRNLVKRSVVQKKFIYRKIESDTLKPVPTLYNEGGKD